MAKRRRKDKIQDETLVDVVEVKESAQDFFEQNKTLVLGIIGGLILIVGGFLIYKYMIQTPKENSAKIAIYKAEQQFARDSFALALENPGGGFEGFLDIIDNYDGTETANLASLYAGISYLNLGRFDDAITYLENHSPSSMYTKIMKNGNLGDAYSELGDYDQALNYYEKAISAGDDALLTPYYLYKTGMLAQETGDTSKALNAYTKIKENYPDSNEGTGIDRLIANISNS